VLYNRNERVVRETECLALALAWVGEVFCLDYEHLASSIFCGVCEKDQLQIGLFRGEK